MAIQMSTTLRNSRCDAIETAVGTGGSIRIYSGAQPANCAAANSGTLLASYNLPSDWLTGAASGQKTINGGPWTDATADGTGTAGHFRLYSDTTGTTCVYQGSVGQGSGDLSLDNTSIVAGQQVSITAFTITEPHA
jgi:hypothetical protein